MDFTMDHLPLSFRRSDRRTFLVASTACFAGLSLNPANYLYSQEKNSGDTKNSGTKGGKAKSTILFFLCGGASHIDTWDMKPNAPTEYRGPFQPISTSASGIELCEHLPLTAKQAHHLAIVRSVGGSVSTNDHHAGYYYQLTGHVPDPTFLSLGNDRRPYADDWPFFGSVIASRRTPHPQLPNAITLPHKPSELPYTRPGQFAAKLGIQHDPFYINGSLDEPLKFQAPSLKLEGDITAARIQDRQSLLQSLDTARRNFDKYSDPRSWRQHQKRTLDLLMSSQTIEAFDVASESEATRERYGQTVNGMSLLLARRLVEAEVPFITVFWKENKKFADQCKSEGGWDTHGNNFNCLKNFLLPEFDRGYSALLEDLAARNLLDSTLVMVTSEMGRQPKIGDPRSGGAGGNGRDHWTHSMSVLLAGGGIRGGQTFGATDRLGAYPAIDPVTPADITKTVYHAMNIDNLQAEDAQGRPYHLLETGRPLTELF
jgi:hypothetical protein